MRAALLVILGACLGCAGAAEPTDLDVLGQVSVLAQNEWSDEHGMTTPVVSFGFAYTEPQASGCDLGFTWGLDELAVGSGPKDAPGSFALTGGFRTGMRDECDGTVGSQGVYFDQIKAYDGTIWLQGPTLRYTFELTTADFSPDADILSEDSPIGIDPGSFSPDSVADPRFTSDNFATDYTLVELDAEIDGNTIQLSLPRGADLSRCAEPCTGAITLNIFGTLPEDACDGFASCAATGQYEYSFPVTALAD